MATINITIPDAQVDRVLNAFGARNTSRLPGQNPRPATPADVRAAIVGYVREVVRDYEASEAIKTAIDTISPVGVE